MKAMWAAVLVGSVALSAQAAGKDCLSYNASVQGLTGKVYSHNSGKIGSIGQIYVDDSTGTPNWVTVKTGLFGSAET
ncbi:MAG: hypothetical protein ACLGI6_20980, partial [Gammaproteobacteria bacterium]